MARITNSIRHTHQYFKMQVTGLWHCSGIDGCTHYMPKNMPEPVGRASICWGCEKSFMLTPVNMLNDKPVCDDCEEKQDVLSSWLEQKMGNGKKTGLEAFGAKTRKDEIEVDDGHAPECSSHIGGDCDCC